MCLLSPTSVFICARHLRPHPYLCSLDLRVPYAVRLTEADIVKLLRGLPDLNLKVIFSEFYFTSTIVSELPRMKHINSMRFKPGPKQGLGGEEEVESFVPVLEQGAFLVLLDLDITARLGDVTHFMNTDFAPINIAFLFIDAYVEHEPKQLYNVARHTGSQSDEFETNIKLVHVPGLLTLIPAKQI
ncbi:hypothetical protein AZE42_04019, partial [Rhizopogon vesiculosus]